ISLATNPERFDNTAVSYFRFTASLPRRSLYVIVSCLPRPSETSGGELRAFSLRYASPFGELLSDRSSSPQSGKEWNENKNHSFCSQTIFAFKTLKTSGSNATFFCLSP
ncbi:MAG: hypothetical protein KJS92_01090, partial [Bacteroidetes bacterium]|nr:hypothetical protein [Bacteroidota bacterium]